MLVSAAVKGMGWLEDSGSCGAVGSEFYLAKGLRAPSVPVHPANGQKSGPIIVTGVAMTGSGGCALSEMRRASESSLSDKD